ncbi:MAG: VWA domain-containing protein [Ignavibacterium sp.]|nr:VWA domain-containing protein [Ignavibacterium sp.]
MPKSDLKDYIKDIFELQASSDLSDDININNLATGEKNTPVAKLNQNAIYSTEVEKFIYNEYLNKTKTFKELIEKRNTELNQQNENYNDYHHLFYDIFNSFYKLQPIFNEDKNLSDFAKMHKNIIQDYMNTEQFKQLHQKTIHDPINTFLASRTVEEEVYKTLLQYFEQNNNQSNDFSNSKDNNQSNNNQSSLSNQLTQVLKQKMTQAHNEINEIDDLIQSYGLEGENNQRMPYLEKKKFLELVRQSKKFKAFSNLVGRYRAVAKSVFNSKHKFMSKEIQNIVSGNDLSSTLSSEYLYLMNEKTKTLFYKKYLNKQLLQYERYSKKDANRGPIIICLDVSSSIGDTEEKWSKAVALAMLEMAQLQKRDYAIIFFSSSVKKKIIIPYGELSYEHIIDIAEFYSGGGTNFERPVQEAFDIINTSKKFKNADIVFITDGEASFSSDEFLPLKQKLQTKFQTVLITTNNNIEKENVSLYPFSDYFYVITDLLENGEQINEMLLTNTIQQKT